MMMKRPPLHLVVAVCDLRALTTVEEVFTRFPVSVGRGGGNALRLDARAVSRHHGAFAHHQGAILQYMDLHSRNGTFIDGIQVEPDVLIPIRDSNVITINPYQLTFHLRHGRPRADRHVRTPIALAPVGPREVSLWKETLARSQAMRRVRGEHGPSDLLRRAAEVIELVAEVIVLFRRPKPGQRSVLRSSRAPDEIVAYLMSPAGGERSLRDLRDLLTELFTQPPPSGARP
jgi:FHA domain